MKILNEAQCSRITELAVTRLEQYVKDNGIKCLVMGISGGIDSTVVAAIALKAIERLNEQGHKTNYHFSYVDIESDEKDQDKAEQLAERFGFVLKKYDYTDWYRSNPFMLDISSDHPRARVAKGNIKCRLRMIHLMNVAQLNGGIYLDTDDLSEWFMGFYTRHGDEGDVKIIQNITKDETYDLAEYFNAPNIVLHGEPGDGLGVTKNNAATDQLMLIYLKTDYIVSKYINAGLDPNGSMQLLETKVCSNLILELSKELKVGDKIIKGVINQMLKTSFKRKYGENVSVLLPSRTEMGLPEIGSTDFNNLYRKAIRLIK